MNDKKWYERLDFKAVIVFISSLSCTGLVVVICVALIKNQVTVESILSILLAFFSMFISIFFYFKADETSSKFYNTSYEFMKDVSVTLGKIEERFGEKLNAVSEKLSHLENAKAETGEELQNVEEDKRLIQELVKKANLSNEERKTYELTLKRKDHEIEMLRERQERIQEKYDMLIRRMSVYGEGSEIPARVHRLISMLTKEERLLLFRANSPTELNSELWKKAQRIGLIDSEGNFIEDKNVILKRFAA